MHTLVRPTLKAALVAIGGAAMLSLVVPAHAALASLDAVAPRTATASVKPNAGAALPGTRLASRITTGTTLRPTLGALITQLTASDCRLSGGIVIVPGDDRCGSLGAAYCRFPDTNAACLNER